MDEQSKDDDFCRIPIKLIEKYGQQIPFDIFIRLSDKKVVKISHKEGDIVELFQKYQEKGLKEVFAKKGDFISFAQQIKGQMKKKFFDPSTTTEEQVELASEGFLMAKESISKFGFSQESIDLAVEVSKATHKMVEKQPNIFKFFQDFKNNCDKEFMHSSMIGFTLCCMIDCFDWKSASIKEKSHLAVMLRDITLGNEEFAVLRDCLENGKEVPEGIRTHPVDIATMLEGESKNFVPSEVITIIRQHHEKPDGSGFPLGTHQEKITFLSALQIVANDFIELMIKFKFDFTKRHEILAILNKEYGKGNFKKAVTALVEAVELD